MDTKSTQTSSGYNSTVHLRKSSGITAGGGGDAGGSLTLLSRKFLLTYWEKRGKEKGKMEKKRKKIKKEVKRWKGGKFKIGGRKVTKLGEDLFFFFFFASHFSKRLKFVLGVPQCEFSTEKKHFKPGKFQENMTLPLLKNIPLMPLMKGWSLYILCYGLIATEVLRKRTSCPSNQFKQIQETHMGLQRQHTIGLYATKFEWKSTYIWLHIQQVLWNHVYCFSFKLRRVNCGRVL